MEYYLGSWILKSAWEDVMFEIGLWSIGPISVEDLLWFLLRLLFHFISHPQTSMFSLVRPLPIISPNQDSNSFNKTCQTVWHVSWLHKGLPFLTCGRGLPSSTIWDKVEKKGKREVLLLVMTHLIRHS